MNTLTLRLELTEEVVRELLWRALEPDRLEMFRALDDAMEQQYAQVGRPSKDFVLTGISPVYENGRLVAELEYTQVGSAQERA